MSDNKRVKPRRVRITGLQEAQVAAIVQIDAACSAIYYEAGFDAAEVPARVSTDFVRMTRDHRFQVAEADGSPAGFLVWHDEAPGVAYIADLAVHPDRQRVGIASQLLSEAMTDASGLGLRHLVVRCWERAPWAMAFYKARGFAPIGASAPGKVQGWAERDTGKPLTRPGEVALWSSIPEPEVDDDDEDDELGAGEPAG